MLMVFCSSDFTYYWLCLPDKDIESVKGEVGAIYLVFWLITWANVEYLPW